MNTDKNRNAQIGNAASARETTSVSGDEDFDLNMDSEKLDPAPGLLRAAAHPGAIVWEEIIQLNPDYSAYSGKSYRAVAEALGFKHTNFHQVMTGRLPMSEKFADQLAERLPMDRKLLADLMRSYQDIVKQWSGGYYGWMNEPLMATASRLDISDPALARILNIEPAEVHEIRRGRAKLDVGADAFCRAGLLIRIGQLLYPLLGDDPSPHRAWLTAHNTALGGVPLQLIQGKFQGLANVVDYLQSVTNP